MHPSSLVGLTTAPEICRVTLLTMRLTEFWARMSEALGEAYARSWARDHVIASLHGRTVVQALEQGENAKDVWRAVHRELGLPPSER